MSEIKEVDNQKKQDITIEWYLSLNKNRIKNNVCEADDCHIVKEMLYLDCKIFFSCKLSLDFELSKSS